METKHSENKLRARRTIEKSNGFTLTELIIAVGILGILSSIAIPGFYRQYQTACQGEAANNLSLLANSASAYKDIYGVAPTTWRDLNDISAVMTTEGPANESKFPTPEKEPCPVGSECPEPPDPGDLKNEITTPGCDYRLSRSSAKSGNKFIFTAVPTPDTGDKPSYNIVSCIDLENGASDLKRGISDTSGRSAEISDLVCW